MLTGAPGQESGQLKEDVPAQGVSEASTRREDGNVHAALGLDDVLDPVNVRPEKASRRSDVTRLEARTHEVQGSQDRNLATNLAGHLVRLDHFAGDLRESARVESEMNRSVRSPAELVVNFPLPLPCSETTHVPR